MESKIKTCNSCVYFLKPDTCMLMLKAKVNCIDSCKDYRKDIELDLQKHQHTTEWLSINSRR